MVIYKITNIINGKSYIGQTIRSPKKRWEEHKKNALLINTPFYQSIKKYGSDNFLFEIIDKAFSVEDLNKKEEECIKLFNTMFPSGFNLKEGGSNKKYSSFSKEKMSMARKGKKLTGKALESTTRHLKNLNGNKTIVSNRIAFLESFRETEQFKKMSSNIMKNNWENADFAKKCSERARLPKSESHRINLKKGVLKSLAKPFEVYRLNKNSDILEFVGVWENVSTCAKDLDLKKCGISSSFKKDAPYRGYKFIRL